MWDTVAAYGLPIAELTRGIDKWVWPLSMPGYHLSPKVEKACHALALDDERDTFHPLLWDEVNDPQRIRYGLQACIPTFGGGYPDDSFSYVSLEWMISVIEESSRGAIGETYRGFFEAPRTGPTL